MPVAYYSRKITGLELNYDIYNKELLAIIEALRHQRVYLEGLKYPVDIYSNHKNLLYQNTTKQLNRRQVRQSEIILAYTFKIHYVRGKENGRADALSRRPDYLEGTKPRLGTLLAFNREVMTYYQPTISNAEPKSYLPA